MTEIHPDSPGPCAECLSRRQFLTRSALVAATAAVAAACGNGQIGPTAANVPSTNGSGTGNNGTHLAVITVGKYAALANTGSLVQVNSYIAVKRTGTATFSAFSMVCTHQGCLTQLSNNAFYCPCHGASFNSNGQVTRGPASRPLQQYATSYDPTTDQLAIG